jgi:hypothetical protein
MLAQMPAGLMAEWMAFDMVEPVSLGYRGDVQAGIIASLIANVNRDVKKRKEAYRVEDFMPEWGSSGENAQEPSPEDVWAKVKAWAERYKKN